MSMLDRDRVTDLLRRPAEGLNVEVKTWIDPTTPEGMAKLIKAAFAIRNRNGGFVLIGFDNKTMRPDPSPIRDTIRTLYSSDSIQALISRYANVPFEAALGLFDHDGQEHPVIAIPNGVKVPVVVKRGLQGDGGKHLLREGDIFFRTLEANGSASSAKIGPADIEEMMEICFENREADIGRFLRRHLGGNDADLIARALSNAGTTRADMIRARSGEVLKRGEKAFDDALLSYPLPPEKSKLINGLTMRVGLALEPENADALPTQEFLDRISAGNPRYTGWPVWLDGRAFPVQADRPYVKGDVWQNLIVDLNGGWTQHLEFMIFDPKGHFFLRRLMQDDLSEKVVPGEELDVILMLYRIAEVLAVGLSISRSCGWSDLSSRAGFSFNWSGLAGRKLSSWANEMIYPVWKRDFSVDDVAASFVEIPTETPELALAPYVDAAARPLFSKFGGYVVPMKIIEDCVRRLVERRL